MAQLHFRRGGILHFGATPLLGLVLLIGCRESRPADDATDSSLARDLTLAASATSTVAIGDTAVSSPTLSGPAPVTASASSPQRAPAPAAAPPRPVPQPLPQPKPPAGAPAPAAAEPSPVDSGRVADTPAPAGRGRTLAAGTELSGVTREAICTMTYRRGDRLVVSLGREVTAPDGVTLMAGTPVLVEVTQVDSLNGEVQFRLRGLQLNGEFIPAEGSVRVTASSVTDRQVSTGGSDKGKVITGAIIGGIMGRVMGGGTRGAIIGAAGGAAAGTVMAARARTTERCLAPGATLTATLSASVSLPPAP
ncbi:hypothetical protein [Gemmatimonas sp.]|uniref:hypothetical protein n=1 Tax=Gemmatimonas sp. TaxID=1962908 RepID=UPI0022C82881|nr:hypothetical protein [Gemmatimonas sp.]MCZ8203843.1 hypothetical protein [Gemmatimonas sp.]